MRRESYACKSPGGRTPWAGCRSHGLSTAKRCMWTKFHEQNSTAPVGPSWCQLAVDPIPPADWGTRSTRSHLGKRPEHEILDFCSRRGGPGGAPRSGPGLPERGRGASGLGFESVPGGVPIGSTGGGRGRPKERRPRRANSRLKSWHGIQCGGPNRSHEQRQELCTSSFTGAVISMDFTSGVAIGRTNSQGVQCGGHCRALALLLRRSRQSPCSG
jgi:hypothetical protein